MSESRVHEVGWNPASNSDGSVAVWDEYVCDEIDEEEDQDPGIVEPPVEKTSNGLCLQDEDESVSKLSADSDDHHSRQSVNSTSATRTSARLEPLDQQQSIFFSVPYEIRALIWTFVVGGGIVHITELRNTLGHVRCMDRSGQKWGMAQHDCWYCSLTVHGFHIAPETYPSPEDRLLRPGSLGLLRSCHRLYDDAINSLYSQNTFGMRSLGTLDLFLHSLPPLRLEHFTSLFLSPIMHSNYQVWDSTWSTISLIPKLKTLRVELRGKLKEREPWAKARLLQGMCVVEQTEVFEVKVPWELMETKEWLWACPFSLEGIYGEVVESGEREYLALLSREWVDVRDWLAPSRKSIVEMGCH